jgi:hypothetical protein
MVNFTRLKLHTDYNKIIIINLDIKPKNFTFDYLKKHTDKDGWLNVDGKYRINTNKVVLFEKL